MGIKSGLANKELLSALLIKQAIAPNTLTDGNTVNTYSVSPQPAAGVDSWVSGANRFRNLLIVCQVASASAGTLTLTLRDDSAALTTANGDANSVLACTFTAISAAGLYMCDLRTTHVFSTTTTRVIAEATDDELRRYLSLRAVAAGGDFVFSSLFIFGNNMGDFCSNSTILTPTWATT